MNNSLRFIRTMGKYTGMMIAVTMLLAAMCIPSTNILKPHAASSELPPEETQYPAIHCMQDGAGKADTIVHVHQSSDGGPNFGPIPPSRLNRMTSEFRRKSDDIVLHKSNCFHEICVTPVRVNHRPD